MSFVHLNKILSNLFQRLSTIRKLKRLTELNIHEGEKLSFTERQTVLEFYPALITPNIVFYDIGAANGSFTRCLAKLRNVSAIHAFEPIPTAFQELTATTKDNPLITCHNVALGNEQGLLDMTVLEGDSRDSSSFLQLTPLQINTGFAGYTPKQHKEPVTIHKLDDYIKDNRLPQPNVIKLDVQGYEDRVLQGGQRTIQAAQFVLIEVSFESLYYQQALFDDIHMLMRNLNFRLISINNAPFGSYSSHPVQVNAIYKSTLPS